MKIGLVCPYNLWKGGGVQECVLAMQHELSRRGHEVKIITPQPRNHSGIVEDHIVLVGNSTSFKSFHTNGIVSAAIDVEAIQDLLEREQFDILHFHEPWLPMLSMQILARSSVPHVATFHAKLPETAMAKTIERVFTPYTKSILKQLDALTAVSNAAAEYVNSLTDRPVNIISNGIDLAKYQKQTVNTPKISPSKKTILYVGRLEKRKGVKYLLKAFSLLAEVDPTVQLIIAGDGEDRQKLEDWVANQDLPRVKFVGFVSDKQKYKLFCQADLFCSPALYGESFGIVLLEAMAMGTVTVAGDNPGYRTVLHDDGEVSLVDPRDTEAFARRLHLLLYDDQMRERWLKWAAKSVQQYDYPKVIDQYEALYIKVKRTAR